MNPIIKFQKENDLVVDGIIGSKTIGKIREKILPGKSKEDASHFIGQCHHESAGFNRLRESLNYSSSGLINTFSYYKKNKVEAYIDGRTFLKKASQKTIANKVYSDHNRSYKYRLGNIFPNDGWDYRGAGPLQITGYSNFYDFAEYIEDLSILENSDLLAEKYYFESAKWFFDKNDIWRFTDHVSFSNVQKVTKIINGGDNGLTRRYDLTRHYLALQ